MKQSTRSLLLFASTLALGGLSACVDPDLDPSDPEEDVDVAVSELQSGPGEYLVANQFTGDARFYIAVTVEAEPSPESHTLQCKLTMGEDDASAVCPTLASLPVLIVPDDDEPAGRLIKVGYAQLEAALTSQGYAVIDIVPDGEDPEYHPAEAEWTNGHWDCVASQADIDACDVTCVLRGGGTVTVDEEFSSNYPNVEPGCKVTCKCGDGTKVTTIDPPQVQPATP